MKDNTILIIGAAAIAAYFFTKKTTTPQSEGEAALSSSTGQAAMGNIAAVYGDKFAGEVAQAAATSKTAGEMMNKLAAPKDNAFGSGGTQQELFQQTSLKTGGGSKGLSAGTYKLGSTTVTVKNVAAKDSIAKQKGYI